MTMASLYIVSIYTNCILWTLSDNKVYLILSYLILNTGGLKDRFDLHMIVFLHWSFWFKYGLDRTTTHPKFDLTGVRTRDLQIMTVGYFSCHRDACSNRLASHQSRHQAARQVGCQPGDCTEPPNLPRGLVWKGINNKLELCPYLWIRELREPTKLVLLTIHWYAFTQATLC